ncbi:MAG: hypothetical protein L0Z55_01695 [Planctomycetes bacterium]|nr:hypothetical protein [Planctomycetota bacterium]
MPQEVTPAAPVPPHPERTRRRLPFFTLLLLGYLAGDTALRAVAAVHAILQGELTRASSEKHFTGLVICGLNLLLALQLFFRSAAARIWCSVFFLLQLAQLFLWYAVRHPEDWLAEGRAGRAQIVVRALFLFAAIVVINRPQPRVVITSD